MRNYKCVVSFNEKDDKKNFKYEVFNNFEGYILYYELEGKIYNFEVWKG